MQPHRRVGVGAPRLRARHVRATAAPRASPNTAWLTRAPVGEPRAVEQPDDRLHRQRVAHDARRRRRRQQRLDRRAPRAPSAPRPCTPTDRSASSARSRPVAALEPSRARAPRSPSAQRGVRRPPPSSSARSRASCRTPRTSARVRCPARLLRASLAARSCAVSPSRGAARSARRSRGLTIAWSCARRRRSAAGGARRPDAIGTSSTPLYAGVPLAPLRRLAPAGRGAQQPVALDQQVGHPHARRLVLDAGHPRAAPPRPRWWGVQAARSVPPWIAER